MRISALGLGLLLLSLCCAQPRVAGAQELDDQTRSAARQLANEGSALYEKSDFEGAYDRFSRAYQLVQKPNVGIWAARSLVHAGRWVEASERYLELERLTLPAPVPPEQQKAIDDAARERRELLGRLPSVQVVLDGAEAGAVFVSLNGRLVPAALLGVKQPVNPGTVLVKGVRGEQVVQAAVELSEGQAREVRLVFAAPAAVSPAPLAPSPPPPAPTRQSGLDLRLFGYIGVGVGGAALVTGAVFGGLAMSDRSKLNDHCPHQQCEPEYHALNDRYGTKKTIASVGLIGGAVLAGAGAVLLLTAPSPDGSDQAKLSAFVTASGAGVWGQF